MKLICSWDVLKFNFLICPRWKGTSVLSAIKEKSMHRFPGSRMLVGALALGLMLGSSAAVRAQSAPGERFAAAVEMYNQKQLVEARDALTAILTEYDTPENRANIEFDSLLAGSLYYLGETCFLEDRFEEAAARYAEVIASFRTFRPESYYHLGLSKHYRQNYQGAIATFGELAAQYPGSALAPQALYYQGICKQLMGDNTGAAFTLREMVEKYPRHAWSKKALEMARDLEVGR